MYMTISKRELHIIPISPFPSSSSVPSAVAAHTIMLVEDPNSSLSRQSICIRKYFERKYLVLLRCVMLLSNYTWSTNTIYSLWAKNHHKALEQKTRIVNIILHYHKDSSIEIRHIPNRQKTNIIFIYLTPCSIWQPKPPNPSNMSINTRTLDNESHSSAKYLQQEWCSNKFKIKVEFISWIVE